MSVWKDEKLASEILSGNVAYPKTPFRAIGLVFVGALVLSLTAYVVLGRKSAGLPTVSKEVRTEAVASETPVPPVALETPALRQPAGKTAAIPASDVIVLPAVVLGDSSTDYPTAAKTAVARDARATNTRCRESDLTPSPLGAETYAAAMAALDEARRTEESASGKLEDLEKARALFQQALELNKLEEKEEAQCLARLTDLANKVILDPKAACGAPKAVFHKVEPGESVEKIARTLKVNQGQIKRVNRLNDKLTIRFGQTLKVLPGEVTFKVNRRRLTGTLYIDGAFIRRYPVGIGSGDATPQGAFTIERKVVNPDWYYDGKKIPFGDPANILGTRWMGFAVNQDGSGMGLGVHGTSLPESVPGRESKGCVRMRNADVEELYDLMPQGGKVVICE